MDHKSTEKLNRRTTSACQGMSCDEFEERDWGYVLKDYSPPTGTDNPVVFAMSGYEGAS